MVNHFNVYIEQDVFSDVDLQVYFDDQLSEGIRKGNKLQYTCQSEQEIVCLRILKEDEWNCKTILEKIMQGIISTDIVFGNTMENAHLPVFINYSRSLQSSGATSEFIKLSELVQLNSASLNLWKKCMCFQLLFVILLIIAVFAIIGLAFSSWLIAFAALPVSSMFAILVYRRGVKLYKILKSFSDGCVK